MRARAAAKTVLALLCILLSCGRMVAQRPAHCAQIFFCLFNQEAAASDPAGIHQYSRDLIDLVLPNQWAYGRSPSGRMETFETEFLDEKYAAKLADRLAQAEQTARTANGKLVAETDVVRAFNDLMVEIGAPSSMRTDEGALRRFREHAAAIKAFPSLFSADRNGANCNPGEAVFLLSLLISDNGILYERNLDSDLALMQMGEQQNGEGRSFGVSVSGIKGMDSGAKSPLLAYSSHHNRNATIAVFNRLAGTLAF